MKIYFSDFFEVSPKNIESYGAFNISLINDLPLFIDPFLLFNSEKNEYKKLHKEIIDYVIFLKKLSQGNISDGLVKSLFRFPEVKQNWLGYSLSGNKGSGLGRKFAFSLRNNLTNVLINFGDEEISDGTHLEKLCLIESGVGRDNISDFSTNLIKKFLLEYTQKFSKKYINKKFLKRFHVEKVSFNYDTKSWKSDYFILPKFRGDFVILTPKDILTKDDSWINNSDTLRHLSDVIDSVPNDALRAHMNEYFLSQLPDESERAPTNKERQYALDLLIRKFPEFLDYYVKYKESKGRDAVSVSQAKVKDAETIFVKQLRELAVLLNKVGFYESSGDSHEEAMNRVKFLKQVIEKNDGYRLFYVKGSPIKREADLQIIFKLTWHATDFDVNSEVNNGRGPVDFKISKGSSDKTLVEFKLAGNTKLKDNLAKQVAVYEAANQSNESIKVILFFSEQEEIKVKKIIKDIGASGDKNIILIDARNDNKPSASKEKIK